MVIPNSFIKNSFQISILWSSLCHEDSKFTALTVGQMKGNSDILFRNTESNVGRSISSNLCMYVNNFAKYLLLLTGHRL